jgi:hypothetical protein
LMHSSSLLTDSAKSMAAENHCPCNQTSYFFWQNLSTRRFSGGQRILAVAKRRSRYEVRYNRYHVTFSLNLVTAPDVEEILLNSNLTLS